MSNLIVTHARQSMMQEDEVFHKYFIQTHFNKLKTPDFHIILTQTIS